MLDHSFEQICPVIVIVLLLSHFCTVGFTDNVSDSGHDHRKIKKVKRTDEEKKKRKKEKKKKKEKEKEDKVVFTQ